MYASYGQVEIPGFTGELPAIPGYVTAGQAAAQRDEASMAASRNGIIMGVVGGYLLAIGVGTMMKKRR